MQFDPLEKVQWGCKLEHLKIVTNRHQHTKTSEDEKVYILNNEKMLILRLEKN